MLSVSRSLLFLLAVVPALASAETLDNAIGRCASLDDAQQRLACYDQAAGKKTVDRVISNDTTDAAATPAHENVIDTSSPESSLPVAPVVLGNFPPGQEHFADAPVAATSLLSQQWDLDRKSSGSLFALRPYRSNYLLPAVYNFSLNTSPGTPSQESTSLYGENLKHTEAQFQISLKTKFWGNALGSPLDLWFGYTQKSYWQVYNASWSSPFRETDYEPELIATLPVQADLYGVQLRLLGAGLVHQSNGQSDPLSRSWNRAYLMAGFERGNWSAVARGWYRIPESSSSDDNPDITKYMGYGDLTVVYQWNDYTLGLLGRLNAATGYGAAQLDLTFPLYGYLRGYARYFDGYGENLLDYNHHNRSIGIGFMLSDWKR